MRKILIAACLLAASAWAADPFEGRLVKFMTAQFPFNPAAEVTLELKETGSGFTVYYAKWNLKDKKSGDQQPFIFISNNRQVLVGEYFNLAKFKDRGIDAPFLGEFLSGATGASMKVVFKEGKREIPELEILQETGFGKVKLQGFLVGNIHLVIGRRFSLDDDPAKVRLAAIDPARGGTLGPAGAPRKLHVFLDMECPHCARFEQELIPLLKGRQDIAATFFQYPLTVGHPLAFKAAAAAFCYLREGSPLYLEFMEYFYPQRGDLDLSSVDGACYAFAEQRGLAEKFIACYMQDANIAEVLGAMQMAVDAGVAFTPAIFLDGVPYRPQDLLAMLKPETSAADPVPTPAPAPTPAPVQ